jgi:hypothetical protein
MVFGALCLLLNFYFPRVLCSSIVRLAFGQGELVIRAMFGPPRNVEGPIDLQNNSWTEAQRADENWLYSAEGDKTILISFKNGACFHAAVYEYTDDLKYQQWKADQIGAYAIGHSESEIISKYGLPQFRSRRTVKDGHGYIEDSLIWRKEDLAPCDGWNYETGYSTSVQLTMKDHHCIHAERLRLFH